MEHIGFIMDGNRRYAKKLSTLISLWHEKWWDNIENVLGYCLDAEIQYVSMWALSKENIKNRDTTEIDSIYRLIRKKLPNLVKKMIHLGIKFETIGDLWLLPPDIRTLLMQAMADTQTWEKITFIIAIAYSGQDEIIRGVRRCIAEGVDPQALTEKDFLTYLDSGRYPPPDLIVRTGGDLRHSWFYLYQSAYSEYYFTDTLWPEFDQSAFDSALRSYTDRRRNFGK
jgi:undecaprenyl diphosphate synthase